MNPLEFLNNYAAGVGTRLRNVIAGDGYLDQDLDLKPDTKSRNRRTQEILRSPQYIKHKAKMDGRQSPYVPSLRPDGTPVHRGPKVDLKPRPVYPGPAGRNIGGGTPKGGLLTGLIEAGSQMVIPHISREAIRGAHVVLGAETDGYDSIQGNGKPVVKSHNGVSYNIATKEGLAAYRKAKGQTQQNPQSVKPTATLSDTPPKPLSVTDQDDPIIADPPLETPTPTPTPTPTETPTPTPTPTPEAETPGQGGDTTKISPTGIVQKGKSLSSANASLEALGIAPLQDAGRFINGKAIKGVEGQDSSTDYGFDSPNAETQVWSEEAGGLVPATAAGTTGKNTEDPQEGASPKPNNADKVRAVRFKRRDGAMSFNGADFSGDEPDNSKLTSPMYANSARNAARSAFLDAPAGQGVMGAIRARDAAVGVHEDGVLLNGKFREWAPGVDAKTKAKARYAATGGVFGTKEGLDEWTGQFLAPDSEATPEKATPQTEQEFDLSGVDEKTKELVGMTQSPLMSKDIPEMSSQKEADKFLKNWRTRAGL